MPSCVSAVVVVIVVCSMPVVDKELIHIQIIEYSSHLSPIRMFRRVASELEVRVCLLEVARFLLLFGSRFFLHDMWVPH